MHWIFVCECFFFMCFLPGQGPYVCVLCEWQRARKKKTVRVLWKWLRARIQGRAESSSVLTKNKWRARKKKGPYVFFVNDMELEFKGGLKAQVFDWNRTQVKNNSEKRKKIWKLKWATSWWWDGNHGMGVETTKKKYKQGNQLGGEMVITEWALKKTKNKKINRATSWWGRW